MKFDFSPIFLSSLVLKPFIDCFSLYQESIWRFWFSIITSSLRFTNSKSKWARNLAIAVWLPLAQSWNLACYDALLSPGLRIHDRRSRGRRSGLLKVPNAKWTESCWWRQTYNHLRQNNRYLPNMGNALGSANETPLNQSRLGIVYVFSIFCISSFGDCGHLQHQESTFFCRGAGERGVWCIVHH